MSGRGMGSRGSHWVIGFSDRNGCGARLVVSGVGGWSAAILVAISDGNETK